MIRIMVKFISFIPEAYSSWMFLASNYWYIVQCRIEHQNCCDIYNKPHLQDAFGTKALTILHTGAAKCQINLWGLGRTSNRLDELGQTRINYVSRRRLELSGHYSDIVSFK